MSRRKRGPSGPRFVLLHHYLMKSAAWKAATLAERCILIDMWQRHNGSNNGQIVYAASDAETNVGIKKSAAAAALRGLLELGFLQIIRDSSFTLKTKEAREYAITAEPIDGRPATKEFMRWNGPRPTPRPHRKSRTRCAGAERQGAEAHHSLEISTQIPQTVRPGAPLTAELTPSRCAQADTSNIPGGPVRFGDAAKAERTRRTPTPTEARGGATATESSAAARANRRTNAEDDVYEATGGGLPRRLGDVLGEVLLKIEPCAPVPGGSDTQPDKRCMGW